MGDKLETQTISYNAREVLDVLPCEDIASGGIDECRLCSMWIVEGEKVREERGAWDVSQWRLGASIDALRHCPRRRRRLCLHGGNEKEEEKEVEARDHRHKV